MKTAHCVASFNIANCLGGVFLKSFGWHYYMVSGHTQEKQNLANILQTYLHVNIWQCQVSVTIKKCALQGVPASSVSIVLTYSYSFRLV